MNKKKGGREGAGGSNSFSDQFLFVLSYILYGELFFCLFNQPVVFLIKSCVFILHKDFINFQ